MTEQEEYSLREAESRIGSVFAERYLLQELIGQGGMGVVYRAQHLHMDRQVAIKMLLPGLAASEYKLGRFQQEARTASNLSHPNIVATFDFGISDDQAFLVMDYIEGRSLSFEIHRCRYLSQERALPIFMQIAEALVHAHNKGIIHRDIKDSNIMLVDGDGNADSVKLVDFGLAKLLSPRDAHVSLTETGQIIGSPYFMSPEQCRGNHCDARADIYSLGCVMYRCLTGMPPFVGGSAIDTIQMHLANLPPPMRSVLPHISVSRDMELLVNKCLFKEPAHRYQSAADLLEDLRSIQSPGQEASSRLQATFQAVSATSPNKLDASQAMSRTTAYRAPGQPSKRGHRGNLLTGALSVMLLASVACAFTAMTPADREQSPQWQPPSAMPSETRAPAAAGTKPPAPAPQERSAVKAPVAVKSTAKPQPVRSVLVLGPSVRLQAAPATAATPALSTDAHLVAMRAPAAVTPVTAPQPIRPFRTGLARQILMERLRQAQQSGMDSPLLLPILIELSIFELQNNDMAEAQQWYHRALRIYEQNASNLGTNSNIRESLCNLSWKVNDLDHAASICTGNFATESSGPNWLSTTTTTPEASPWTTPVNPNPVGNPQPQPQPQYWQPTPNSPAVWKQMYGGGNRWQKYPGMWKPRMGNPNNMGGPYSNGNCQ